MYSVRVCSCAGPVSRVSGCFLIRTLTSCVFYAMHCGTFSTVLSVFIVWAPGGICDFARPSKPVCACALQAAR